MSDEPTPSSLTYEGGELLDLTRFDALTFDCYGTLVDWERGIVGAVHEMVDAAAPGAPRPPIDGGEVLQAFATLEALAERGPFRLYRAVLEEVAGGIGRTLGIDVTAEGRATFAASVAAWPPFPDTVASLRALAARYRLAIVSNVDDDLFRSTARRLHVPFEAVVTAEQVRSYKPAPAHFHEVLRRLGLPPERVLHVAQSLYHDVAPARALGFTCVWVNRRAGRSDGGATPAADASPDLDVPDLASLVRLAGL